MVTKKYFTDDYRVKVLENKVSRDTEYIYAALAISLYRNLGGSHEDKVDAIEQIFADSQKVWTESVIKNVDMIDYCRQLTGINMKGK